MGCLASKKVWYLAEALDGDSVEPGVGAQALVSQRLRLDTKLDGSEPHII